MCLVGFRVCTVGMITVKLRLYQYSFIPIQFPLYRPSVSWPVRPLGLFTLSEVPVPPDTDCRRWVGLGWKRRSFMTISCCYYLKTITLSDVRPKPCVRWYIYMVHGNGFTNHRCLIRLSLFDLTFLWRED